MVPDHPFSVIILANSLRPKETSSDITFSLCIPNLSPIVKSNHIIRSLTNTQKKNSISWFTLFN